MRSRYDYGRRRLRRFVLGIAVLGFLGIALNWAYEHRPVPRTGSHAVASSTPFRIGRIPRSYYAEFEVDTRAGKRVVNVEKTWVRRPFESRIETWSGRKRLSVRQSAFGAFANFNPNSTPLSIAVPPSLGSGDLRVDIALDEALRRHVIVKREKRSVYGRICQTYRAGGPVSAGDLTRYNPKSGEYADFCVDRDGIVIEEWWVRGNKLLRRRVATKVRVGKVDVKLFAITTPPAEGIDKGTIAEVPDGASKQKLWTIPAPPKGFVRLGRFFVALPTAATPNPGPDLGETTPVSSLTDVYTDGPDLFVIDQGAGLSGPAAAENRPSFHVTIPGLSHAVLIVDARENEIRADTPDGSFVRIAGTLRPSRLLAIARELRLTDG